MQLMKQVYFAHGWYLALTKKPLLNETIQAWQFGPVAPSVYHAFKNYKGSDITALATDLDLDKFEYVTPMLAGPETNNLMRFLEKISDTYGKMSGTQLSNLTHQPDSPWFTVWNQDGGKDRKHTNIPDELIKDYFCTKLTKIPQAVAQ